MEDKTRRTGVVDRLRSLSPEQIALLRQAAVVRQVKGHARVAEALGLCGIKRVFGIAGTPVDRVFSECVSRGIRLVGTRHQQAAVLMAASGNFVTGRLDGAAVVSAGPAATNTVTGLLVARDNRWPVLVLAGRRPLQNRGIGYFQELDSVPIMSPVTKWAATVQDGCDLAAVIVQAYERAIAPPPGPVYLELPEDILEQSVPQSDIRPPAFAPVVEANRATLQEAAQLVLEARRPLLILGEGIRWSFSTHSLLRLVDGFGLPFITTPLGRGYLPDDHPLCANLVRRAIQSHADVVLMAGAWFDWRFRFGAELGPQTQVIHADADPSTLSRNVQPRLSVAADPGRFLAQLAELLDRAPGGPVTERVSEWHQLIRAECSRACDAAGNGGTDAGPRLSPRQLFREMRGCLPEDAVLTVEGNITLSTAQKELTAKRPVSWLDPGWNGCIGVAVPFAVGAKAAFPERPVIAICSDTGFGISGMELETAVRNRIPIVVVVANNDGNTGRNRQRLYFPPSFAERFTEYMPELRYDRIGEALGCHAENVHAVGEIGPALLRAFDSGRPACINVLLDPDAPHPGFW